MMQPHPQCFRLYSDSSISKKIIRKVTLPKMNSTKILFRKPNVIAGKRNDFVLSFFKHPKF